MVDEVEGGGLDRTRDLLLRALDGDEEARGELLERLRPRIILWVATRLSPEIRRHHDPEDVTQEVLLAVHRGMDDLEYRGDPAFHAWLYRVAGNRIRDLADHTGARKRQEVPITPFSQTSPTAAAVRSESFRMLHEAIGGLPEHHREVIRLRYIEDRSVAETAEILGRSENAVRLLALRAVRALAGAFPGDL
jgi:RNA polymerase sigma-70 factor (ECF subfamily)